MLKDIKLFLIFTLLSSFKAIDVDLWEDIKNAMGGFSWTECASEIDPCSCSFVTCADGDITRIDFPNNLYTGLSISFNASLLNEIESVFLGTGNSWALDEDTCYNGMGESKCSGGDLEAFCCFEKYKIDFFDTFNGNSWTRCSSRRLTLCGCDPSPHEVEVQCTDGIATFFNFADNGLVFPGTEPFPSDVINNLVDSGLTYLKVTNNPDIDLHVDDCPYISGCLEDAVTCEFPASFITCIPTMAPTVPQPTSAPIVPPSAAPTLSPITCTNVNEMSIGKNKRKRICDALDQCEFKKGNCNEITPSPTLSPIIPTEEPTSSPTVFISCEDINDFGLRTSKKICRDRGDCLWKKQICSTLTPSPTFSPVVPVEAPTQSPIACNDYNELGQSKRRKGCLADARCGYDSRSKQCGEITFSPSVSPSTPTAFSCAYIDDKDICEASANVGCEYFKDPDRRSVGICLEVGNETNLDCGVFSDLFTEDQIRKECARFNKCIFDSVGSNKGGACFEISSCLDVNQLGKGSKIRQYCLDPTLNGGNGCRFKNKTCLPSNET
eukprot:snap_masked-scaffold_52-processed-gene-0.16-mRNA-1 protein AED:1.00 eAED:1.00 QI:0/0/0/0/1/1/3/0/551